MAAKPDIRFQVSTRRDSYSSYLTVRLESVLVRDGEVISPGYSHDATDVLSDLVISAQADISNDTSAAERWYGWQIWFVNPYHVDLSRARGMVKVLDGVARKMRRAESDAGRPESFHAYALRAARAAGATADNPFGVRDAERSYDGTGYRWLGADGLAHYLSEVFAGKVAVTS